MSLPNNFVVVVNNRSASAVVLQNIISQTKPTNADIPMQGPSQTLVDQLFVTIKLNNLFFNNWTGTTVDATAPNYIENQIPVELSSIGLSTEGCQSNIQRAKVYTADMQYFLPLSIACLSQSNESIKMMIDIQKPVKATSSGLSTTAIVIIVVVCVVVAAGIGAYFYYKNNDKPSKTQ